PCPTRRSSELRSSRPVACQSAGTAVRAAGSASAVATGWPSAPAACAPGHLLRRDAEYDRAKGERIVVLERVRNERAQQAHRLLPQLPLRLIDDVEATVHEHTAPVEEVVDLVNLEHDRPPPVLVLREHVVFLAVRRPAVEPAIGVDVIDRLHLHAIADRIRKRAPVVAREDLLDLVPLELTEQRRRCWLSHPPLPVRQCSALCSARVSNQTVV